MRKIGIIGVGHVGATIAYTLVVQGLADQLVLIDESDKKVIGEQYDLLDTMAGLDTVTTIKVQDYAALNDADVLITAFGSNRDESKSNEQIVTQIAAKIESADFTGVLINISDPCDLFTALLQAKTELPVKHVIGTGTLVDTVMMRRAIGLKLDLAPQNIGGYVYGSHGGSTFTAWSTVTVNGRPINEIQGSYGLNFESLMTASNYGGWLALAGKGFTNYAITTCVIKLVRAILSNAHLAVPVSTYSPEFETYIGRPAVVGANGAESLIMASLSELEQGQLKAAASVSKQKIDGLHRN